MEVQDFDRSRLTRFAWLSVGAAVITIALKTTAYFLTGSVGLLSDALESIVNLVGATLALVMLAIAARPADKSHTYGHSKAEYFSSGIEGALILVAAISIIYTAIERLINPQPLEKIGIGLIVSLAATMVNLTVSIILQRAGKKYNSISLASNGKHLMTDVWTSGGVLVGVGAVALSRWQTLDPIVAILVALNIIWTGIGIMRKSVAGLMDSALPAKEMAIIEKVIQESLVPGVEIHALRTRQSAANKFISMHVLVPGDWTVTHGHEVVTVIEGGVSSALPGSVVITHFEPLDTPISHEKTIIGNHDL
jgi:cation diffusion facilitator family transporter